MGVSEEEGDRLMARSKRARRTATTPEALVRELPEEFLEPEIGDDLLGSLRGYISRLERWVEERGVRPDRSRTVALQIMAEIGASPADWYRQAMESPTCGTR